MRLSCHNRGSRKEQHSQQNNSNQSRARDNKAKSAQVQLGKATETRSQVVATGSLRGSTDQIKEINKISLELGVHRIDRCISIRIDKRTVETRPQRPPVRRSWRQGSPDQVKEINRSSLKRQLGVYRIDRCLSIRINKGDSRQGVTTWQIV